MGIKIIVLRLDDAERPLSIRRKSYINLFPDYNNGFQRFALLVE